MEPAYIVSDDQARMLLNNLGKLDKDEKGLLKVWCFHNQPPEKLLIAADPCFEYALSDYGDRLGLVSREGCQLNHLLFFGDNGWNYYGECINRAKRVYQMEVRKNFSNFLDQLFLT